MAKLLIIDGSRTTVRLAKTILNEQGHKVHTEYDGEAGWLAVKKLLPDLVIMDLVLPGLMGSELCEKIKKDPETRSIPIIILTSKRETEDIVEGFEAGAADYVVKPFKGPEFVARVETQLKIKELHTALEKRNQELLDLANRDGLTGLYNHRYFMDTLLRDFKKSQRYEEPISVVFLDIDHFKQFNDTYGHQAGDEVLHGLAKLLVHDLRGSDVAARYGGEEFALLLYRAPKEKAVVVAQRIRKSVENQDFMVHSKALKVTVSLGVASYPHKKIKSAKSLLETADKALYKAKKLGRNRVNAF